LICGIPQYNLGYIEHEKYFEKFEQQNPGMFLSGNYRGGISVGDCIINSENVCKRIVDFTAQGSALSRGLFDIF
jgi:oxygen-dependent protoporphyrinogen oxidase